MTGNGYWDGLRSEIQSQNVTKHPLYIDLVGGRLKRPTIAQLCAQLKFTVTDGISSLSLIIPQVPREIKKELAENLFHELAGTPAVPSHWELALVAGAAAGFSEADVDAIPMYPETKVYPDTVAAYAVKGSWLEALSFVALGIEDMFVPFCAGVVEGLKKHYGYGEREAAYFAVHIGADEIHSETGWSTAKKFATSEEKKRSVRRAALEGRNMWWNMYSAIYRAGEGKDAPILRTAV